MTARRALSAAGIALSLAALASPSLAQRRPGAGFSDLSGEQIYTSICQGCHMPDGKGAQGAGMYPALAGDARLAAKAYPAMVVVRGQKAMPEFGGAFSDAQIADVVNYIRTHFGNSFPGAVTAAEVKALRPAGGPGGEVRPPG